MKRRNHPGHQLLIAYLETMGAPKKIVDHARKYPDPESMERWDSFYERLSKIFRGKLAREILDAPYPNPSPAIPAWHAGYTEALENAVRVVRGEQKDVVGE